MRGGFDRIILWTDNLPQGEWWERTSKYVEIVRIDPPGEIFGKPITQPAHKSDVIRLQVLLEYGGVYADTDTIFIKSFDTLLHHRLVLGQQNISGSEGYCPAIILSEPNSIFLQKWLEGFKDSFHGGGPGTDTWCTHSVHYPAFLLEYFKGYVHIMNHEAFFWPLYHENHMKMLFEEIHEFPNAYSHHLWESSGKRYLEELTVDSILSTDTTFTRAVKDLL